MDCIGMDNWLVAGFKNEDGVDLYIYGDVIYSDVHMRNSALIPIVSFDPFTPIAYSKNKEINLTLNGEMISVLGDICSPALEIDVIIWALVNEPFRKAHYDILQLVNENSFKIEYTA